MNLNEYENEILGEYEAGNLKSIGLSESEKERLSEVATNTLKKIKE